jgi:3D (Asp-Asp-Asp) domain-containing protein
MMAVFAIGADAQIRKSSDSKPTGYTKTKPVVVTTASVEPTGSLKFTATAYSLRGKMANGQGVHRGAIAADPRVLPLGTRVYIDGMGEFTVKDTGGAIKGNRIDIWMSSGARIFGRRTVKLKVISRPTRKK